MSETKNVHKDRGNVTWSCDDEATLVRTLKKTKDERLWGDNNPKDVAWTACVAALAGSEKISGGAPKDDKAIKRRWQRLKHEYDMMNNMRDQSGWGWDHEKNIPKVSDKVWDAYIQKQSNPNTVKPLRKKGFPLFYEMSELVDGMRATGQNAFRAGQAPPDPPTQSAAPSASTSYEPAIDPALLNVPLETGRVSDEETNLNATVSTTKRSFYDRELDALLSSDDEAACTQTDKGKTVKRQSAPPTNTGNDRRKVRRVSAGQGISSMGNSVETAMDSLTGAINGSTQRAPRSEAWEIIPRAIEAIETDEGFSDKDIKDAACVIAKDPMLGYTYLNMKNKTARTAFLLHHMNELTGKKYD